MKIHHRSQKSEQECLKVHDLICITVDRLHINKVIEGWGNDFAY